MEQLSTYLTLRLSALQVLPYSRITLPPWAAKMPNQNPLVSNGWSSFSFGDRTTGVAKGKSTCNEEAAEEEKRKVQNTHTRRNKVRRGGCPHRTKDTSLFRLPKQQMEKFSTLKYNHLGKKFPHVKFHISPLLSSRTVHHKNDQTPNDTYPSWMPTPLDVHGRRHASGQDVLGRQDPALFVVVDHAVNLLHACFVEQMMNEEDEQKNKWG
jgi:hypothetical protein